MTSNTSNIPTKKLDTIMSNQSNNYLVIKRKLENIDFEPRVLQLYNRLITDTDELNNSINNLSQEKSTLVSTKRRFFIETLDKNATISNIISHNNQIVECFKKNFDRIHERMSGTIDLIQLLATLENDISKTLEEHGISLNKFQQAVNEIYEEQMEFNSQMGHLFKESFERTFILRDRIKAIEDENSHIKNEISTIQLNITKTKEQITDDINQIKNDVSTTHLDFVKTQETITTLKTEINSETDKKLDQYIKKEVVYTQKEVDDLLCKKCKEIWIVYGMSTIILLAGIVASFLI